MTDQNPITASCHCGAVTVAIDALPGFLMDCNCTLCASHGALWGYYAPEAVSITGETKEYRRADKPDSPTLLHFCGACGCTICFVAKQGDATMIGVNMKLFEPRLLSGLQVQYGDGRSWSGEGPWGFRREPAPYE